MNNADECLSVPVPKPPKIDMDKVPKEIFIKQGENITLEIPYTGFHFSQI